MGFTTNSNAKELDKQSLSILTTPHKNHHENCFEILPFFWKFFHPMSFLYIPVQLFQCVDEWQANQIQSTTKQVLQWQLLGQAHRMHNPSQKFQLEFLLNVYKICNE